MTAKYTWWSFLPLFLYEQYSQFQNVYYLLNAIAGYIVVLITPIANVLPIIFVLLVAAVRELVEDASRHAADRASNGRPYEVVRAGAPARVRAQDICRGDLLVLRDREECPCDCVLLRSSGDAGVCYVSTSNLDGETALKPRYELLYGASMDEVARAEYALEAAPPNTRMEEFAGTLGGHAFKAEHAVLRGVRLENVERALLAVVYTGREAKIMASRQKLKMKSSQMNQRMHGLVIYQVILSAAISFALPLVSGFTAQRYHRAYFAYTLEPDDFGANYLNKFIIYFLLMAYFIPVSLFVTIELARMASSIQIDSDLRLRTAEFAAWLRGRRRGETLQKSRFAGTNGYQLACQAKNIVSVENLQELDVIFTDKTGTLTRNQMVFHSCVDVQGRVFEYRGAYEPGVDPALLYGLALCNTVVRHPRTGQLQAESPDEVAFVSAAETLGLRLVERRNREVEYCCARPGAPAHPVVYERLAVVPFSSDRKRMSICLREAGAPYAATAEQDALLRAGACALAGGRLYFTPAALSGPGEPFVLTKGADAVMAERLAGAGHAALEGALAGFAARGLRVLLFAARPLAAAEAAALDPAAPALDPADPRAGALEGGLAPLGASAVEDRLQDEVPATLAALARAGVRVWMLTGDRAETAVSISHAAGLVGPRCRLLYLTRRGYAAPDELARLVRGHLDAQRALLPTERARAEFDARLRRLRAARGRRRLCVELTCGYLDRSREAVPQTDTALVLDGYTLEQLARAGMLPELCQLMCYGTSGVCCRMLPNQKAKVVAITHRLLGFNTAAVGDGANDVMMIREAKTGIGIAGKEGMHACNSADITMPEFKFLRRIVFCYGRLMHLRNQELFEYIIEKNCILATANIVYSFYNLFTVQIFVDSLLLLLFNLLTTLFPILFQSITEVDLRLQLLEEHPEIYRFETLKYRPSARYFTLRMLRHLYYSIVLIVALRYMNAGGIGFRDGKLNDINTESYCFYNALLLVSSVEFVLHQSFYSYFTLGGLMLMIVITVLASWIGNFTDFFGVMLLSVPAQVTL